MPSPIAEAFAGTRETFDALKKATDGLIQASKEESAVIAAVREEISKALNAGVLIDPLELLGAMAVARMTAKE